MLFNFKSNRAVDNPGNPILMTPLPLLHLHIKLAALILLVTLMRPKNQAMDCDGVEGVISTEHWEWCDALFMGFASWENP